MYKTYMEAMRTDMQKRAQINTGKFKNAKSGRIWEVDFVRGIALIMMIYFHVVSDMGEFFGYHTRYFSGPNFYIGKISAILFILVSGVSCSFSRNNVKRGVKVFGIAMVITVVTYFFDPQYCVKFGILHFLGIAMILYPLVRKLNKYAVILLGTLFIICGYIFSNISINHNYLFPLGIISESFTSGDYYPLIPWLGVFLYGSALGRILYPSRRSIFKGNLKETVVNKAGKHTLFIYVVHQPLIMLILTIIKHIRESF
jgi:uncharacterized membrane protein